MTGILHNIDSAVPSSGTFLNYVLFCLQQRLSLQILVWDSNHALVTSRYFPPISNNANISPTSEVCTAFSKLPFIPKQLKVPKWPHTFLYWRDGYTNWKTFQVLLCLSLILLTWRIWWAPNNASRWQVGFNWAFNPYPANVENMVSS